MTLSYVSVVLNSASCFKIHELTHIFLNKNYSRSLASMIVPTNIKKRTWARRAGYSRLTFTKTSASPHQTSPDVFVGISGRF
jgi:hypothetical protein